MQRSLVANGFGVALIYTRPFGDRSYDGQALVCRPTEEKLPTHSIVLAHDQRYPLTPSAEAFKELAQAPNQKFVMMPMESSGIIGSLGGIAELAKEAMGKNASKGG